MKERDLLQRLVRAVGDCEDTDAILQITKEASELLKENNNIEYYRSELIAFQATALRAVTASEYLLKDFNKRFHES